MLKSELRKIYLEKRKTLSKDEVLSFSESVFKQFVQFFKPKSGQKIHLFLSIERFNEVDTKSFINYCWSNEIQVFVPKMKGDELISIELTPSTVLEQNKWGILEPISNEDSRILDFDFVITPLLYCDTKGNRVGYGKGFYDRLFSEVSSQTQKIGVNFFPPNEDIDDVWENDIPLDYLCLPAETVSFTGFV
jgi:5-formyltetrahydrofolate cyclo-ligase